MRRGNRRRRRWPRHPVAVTWPLNELTSADDEPFPPRAVAVMGYRRCSRQSSAVAVPVRMDGGAASAVQQHQRGVVAGPAVLVADHDVEAATKDSAGGTSSWCSLVQLGDQPGEPFVAELAGRGTGFDDGVASKQDASSRSTRRRSAQDCRPSRQAWSEDR
jgi:hypothetical protein